MVWFKIVLKEFVSNRLLLQKYGQPNIDIFIRIFMKIKKLSDIYEIILTYASY